VLVAIPERHVDPTARAEAIARLVMQGLPAQPRVPVAVRQEIGTREVLEYRCARQRARAERSPRSQLSSCPPVRPT
jgi:hypothetical protein